jgi:hypothetical protein
MERWERYAPGAGIVFIVLALVSTFIAGEPPGLNDSAREVADYFDDNDAAIRWGQFIGSLAVIPLLWWLGSLWSTLRRAEGGAPRLTVTAGLGAVVAATSVLASSAVLSTAALRQDSLGPDGLRFFYTFSALLLAVAAFGAATLVLASSVVVLRSQVFPAWVAWLGLVSGAVWVASGLVLVSTRDAVFFLGLIAFILWAVWVIAVSVLMLRAPDA